MTNTDSRVQTLVLFRQHNLRIDTDMFGAFFAYDPTGRFTSPSFTHIEDVIEWIDIHKKEVEDRFK